MLNILATVLRLRHPADPEFCRGLRALPGVRAVVAIGTGRQVVVRLDRQLVSVADVVRRASGMGVTVLGLAPRAVTSPARTAAPKRAVTAAVMPPTP